MSDTTQKLNEIIGEGRLGRHVHHDERSRNFRAQLAPTIKSKKHRLYGKVLDQGNLGSCTGNALVHCLHNTPTHIKGKNYKQDTAVKLYSEATKTDPWPGEYPPTDTGSSGLDVCKAAVKLGFITRYEWTFSIDQMLAALMLRPVMVGVPWYTAMDEPDPVTGLINVGGYVRGGHEFAVNGVDLKKEWLHCIQSWGNWGLKGKFKISISDMQRLLDEYGDCAVPIV